MSGRTLKLCGCGVPLVRGALRCEKCTAKRISETIKKIEAEKKNKAVTK